MNLCKHCRHSGLALVRAQILLRCALTRQPCKEACAEWEPEPGIDDDIMQTGEQT